MATLTTPKVEPLAFLTPGSTSNFELHALCTWGAISHPEGEVCNCTRLIRVRTALDNGHHQVVTIIEPGATHDDFWAAVEWASDLSGPITIGDYAWRVAFAQC